MDVLCFVLFKGNFGHKLIVLILISENSQESIEKASEMLTSLDNTISGTKLPVYTNNIVINTVVGAKDEKTRNIP